MNQLELWSENWRKDDEMLHPLILNSLFSHLDDVPYAHVFWPKKTQTIAEKNALIQSHGLSDVLSQGMSHFHFLPEFHLPDLWFVRTLSYTLPNQSQGLVTSFIQNPDEYISSAEKKQLLMLSGYAEIEDLKLRQKQAAEGKAVITNKILDRVKFASKSGINLENYGLGDGYAGPWCLQQILLNVILQTSPQIDRTSYYPVYDIALGNTTSLLLTNIDHVIKLATDVALDLGGSMPIIL